MREFAVAVRALLRNRDLVRLAASWELFVFGEFAAWIAMVVYAYDRGGASAAGVVAVVQLVPGVLLAPVFAAVADRSPVGVLAASYAVQAVAAGATAVVLALDGPPAAAYAAATVLTTAITATRPAQAALTPSLARSTEQLAALGAVLGWLENVGIMTASALTGVALALGGPTAVFVAVAVCAVLAAVLLVGLGTAAADDDPDHDAHNAPDDEPTGALAAVREAAAGIAEIRRNPAARLLVGLQTAVFVVVGALDVLFVVLAVDVLHRDDAWTGYLNTAYGAGGVLALAAAGAFLGRRLRRPLLLAGLVLALGVAATVLPVGAVGVVALLFVAGLGRAVADTLVTILLQRAVPPRMLARVFGVGEALSGLGLALGSLLVPLGVALGGSDLALGLTAAVVPLVLLLTRRALRDLDAAARVPVTEIALLRAQPHLRALPPADLEGVAAVMERRSYADGDVVVRQGEPGTEFFVVADGRVTVVVDGVTRRTCTRPEGIGEIALLRRVPRSATVTADGPAVLYALPGETFLDVVTGHAGTARRVGSIATDRLAGDPSPPD